MNVRYSRLFSLGNYQNEKIGFGTEVDEKDADTTLGLFFMKVIGIEKMLQRYRGALNDCEMTASNLMHTKRNISQKEQQISDMKIKIGEIARKLEKGELDDDEVTDKRLRHACDARSLKQMKASLQDLWNRKDELEETLKKSYEISAEIENRIKAGNFSLDGIADAKHQRFDDIV